MTLSRDLQLALVAGVIYAGTEVYLGDRYPLRDPIPLPTRMAFAGGLAVLCTLAASLLVKPDAGRLT